MSKLKLALGVFIVACALYGYHIAGVASMPGTYQTFFLNLLLVTQAGLVAAAGVAFWQGKCGWRSKYTFILSAVVALAGGLFAGSASGAGPDQLQFLLTFAVTEGVLLSAIFGANIVGRHSRRA